MGNRLIGRPTDSDSVSRGSSPCSPANINTIMRFNEILSESKQIALAKKAYAMLSIDAKDAISSWESSNWIGGPLEKHIIANDKIAQEIHTAFQPVRDSIPGESVKLFRGIQPREQEHDVHLANRVLESWTSERVVAEYFAGLRTDQTKQGHSTVIKVPSVDEVEKAIAQYNAKGYTRFANHYFMKNKENPRYYNIYDRNKQFVTDGDNIDKDLRYWYEDYLDSNDDAEKGRVLEEYVNKNRIVWITNNLNSKEYIIRVD